MFSKNNLISYITTHGSLVLWSSLILALIFFIVMIYRRKDLRYLKNLQDYKTSKVIAVIFTAIYLVLHLSYFIYEQKTNASEKNNIYSNIK